MNQTQWKTELETRIQKLIGALAEANPDFETALVAGRINQYYLTGTMQDAVLILKRDGKAYLFVRKSVERAKDECPLDIIYPMGSYRDMLQALSPEFGATYLETETVPVAMLERFRKYFKIDQILPFEPVIAAQRAVKSPYELELITRSGKQHKILLEEIVPALLREGISEAEFHGALFAAMMKLGFHGVTRFTMFQFESVAGQIGFGDNSVYPTNFDGPGGMRGMNAASPGLGSRERKLCKGDLVFADVGFGIDGYHSDKTQVYSFGKAPDPEVIKVHRACMDIQKRCAEMLIAGAIPSRIYAELTDKLPLELSTGFMGYDHSVKFLGHGIGLHINELPVIARGFDEPLKENMVLAVEPKCG
ncbi:MAG TPA: M24 family metallopeptidase, partial [Oscillospiraceae bacterium]|nr:M24 family metallopeptidase [Oscillospiraceae bacterium]